MTDIKTYDFICEHFNNSKQVRDLYDIGIVISAQGEWIIA